MVFKGVTLIAMYISKPWKMTIRFIYYYMLMICLIACKDMDKIIDSKQLLMSAFEIKDLGAAKKNLGAEFIKDMKNCILCFT